MNQFPIQGAETQAAWLSNALCRSMDPDKFFVRGVAQRKAALICRNCPVIVECAARALDQREAFGVWGGMTARERRALLKQHPQVVSWVEVLRRAAHRRQAFAPGTAG